MFCFLVCLVYLCGTYDKHGKCCLFSLMERRKFYSVERKGEHLAASYPFVGIGVGLLLILNCDMDSLCNRGILDFEDNKISNITLGKAITLRIIELENTEINTSNISNRKTARLLKDSAYKSNNNIDGLKYRALELDIYQSKEAQLPWYSNDKVILFLNKISNNYDRNFWWGVGWTFASAIIAFWGINYFGTTQQIFELNYKFDFTEFGEIWKKYLDVLNVLNFRERLNGVELNAVGETIFLVSKVIIAYFMYQTIAAFRKYRKNP